MPNISVPLAGRHEQRRSQFGEHPCNSRRRPGPTLLPGRAGTPESAPRTLVRRGTPPPGVTQATIGKCRGARSATQGAQAADFDRAEPGRFTRAVARHGQTPHVRTGQRQCRAVLTQAPADLRPVLNELPNRIQISGHTDSHPYPGGEAGYNNWDLSADRAKASRQELVAGGLDSDKLLRVSGMSDRIRFHGAGPYDASNRRIEIIVLDSRAAQRILSQDEYGPLDIPEPTPRSPPQANLRNKPDISARLCVVFPRSGLWAAAHNSDL